MKASFGMLELGKKLTFESFRLLLVATLLMGCRNLSQSSKSLNYLAKEKFSDSPWTIKSKTEPDI